MATPPRPRATPVHGEQLRTPWRSGLPANDRYIDVPQTLVGDILYWSLQHAHLGSLEVSGIGSCDQRTRFWHECQLRSTRSDNGLPPPGRKHARARRGELKRDESLRTSDTLLRLHAVPTTRGCKEDLTMARTALLIGLTVLADEAAGAIGGWVLWRLATLARGDPRRHILLGPRLGLGVWVGPWPAAVFAWSTARPLEFITLRVEVLYAVGPDGGDGVEARRGGGGRRSCHIRAQRFSVLAHDSSNCHATRTRNRGRLAQSWTTPRPFPPACNVLLMGAFLRTWGGRRRCLNAQLRQERTIALDSLLPLLLVRT